MKRLSSWGGGGVKTFQPREGTRSSIISAYKSVMENLLERERKGGRKYFNNLLFQILFIYRVRLKSIQLKGVI